MTALDIKEIRKKNNLTQSQLASKIGVSLAIVAKWESGKYPIPDSKKKLLKNTFTSKNYNNFLTEPDSTYKKLQKTSKKIPLVSTTAVAGFGALEFCIEEKDIIHYYEIPDFKNDNITFAITVTGDSMQPKYSPGNRIACSVITKSTFIQWNRVHAVATREQGILIKRLLPSDKKNHILAVSDNKDYPPFDIPEEEITGIALVLGGVFKD